MIEGGQIQDWVEVIDAQYLITQENISEHLED
jgi:hypothetical protein